MINKLTIELALRYRDCDKYSISSFDYSVTKQELDIFNNKKDNKSSFLYTLDRVDFETKGMLRLVEYHLLQEIKELENIIQYSILNSYSYFSFTDEMDRTIFSSPYITSPILFDPNENQGSYKLYDDTGWIEIDLKKSKVSKQTNINIARYDINNQLECLIRKQPPPSEPIFSIQDIVNSLFNYYTKTSNGMKSVYQPESDNLIDFDIYTTSQRITRYFYYNPIDENNN